MKHERPPLHCMEFYLNHLLDCIWQMQSLWRSWSDLAWGTHLECTLRVYFRLWNETGGWHEERRWWQHCRSSALDWAGATAFHAAAPRTKACLVLLPWLSLSTVLPGVLCPSLAPGGFPGCSLWTLRWCDVKYVLNGRNLQGKKLLKCELQTRSDPQAGAKSSMPG